MNITSIQVGQRTETPGASLLFQGLLVMMMVMTLTSSLPIIPSGLALVTAPVVCPLFYVSKAVRTAQAAINVITG